MFYPHALARASDPSKVVPQGKIFLLKLQTKLPWRCDSRWAGGRRRSEVRRHLTLRLMGLDRATEQYWAFRLHPVAWLSPDETSKKQTALGGSWKGWRRCTERRPRVPSAPSTQSHPSWADRNAEENDFVCWVPQ